MVHLTPLRKTRSSSVPPSEKSRSFKQRRSKVTHDALIRAGFALVAKYDIEQISIAELARHAGYSVGGFYAIFPSKDEFFDALINAHLAKRTETHKGLMQTCSRERLIDDLLTNIVRYYWDHHVFWRAVLRRTLLDSELWEPFRVHFRESTQRFEARIAQELQRRLTAKEKNTISFAFQMVMGTINISILNQPGPVMIGERRFTKELTRAFKLLSGVEELLSAAPARGNGKK